MCEQTISHNFTGASEVEDEDTDDSTRSDTLVFADIQEGPEGEAVLVVEGAIYPGTEKGDGSWTFSWASSRNNSDETAIETYQYSKTENIESIESFNLTFNKGTASGNLQTDNNTEASYEETDLLEGDVPPDIQSQIPSNRWLVVTTDTGSTMPATNRLDNQDCEDTLCTLSVSVSCTMVQQVSATLTGYEDAADYGGIGDARQTPGT